MTQDAPLVEADTSPTRPPDPPAKRSWLSSLALALFTVSALLGSVWIANKVSNPLNLYGTALPANKLAPPLSGTGDDAKPLALTDLSGQTVAVFFGFLNCPNICPTTLAALERVRQTLPADRQANFVPLLISVDPKRDTVSKLNEYVKYFNPQARGMIIPEPQLAEGAKAWGVGYQYVDVKGPLEYQVNHTTGVYLVHARGRLRLVWDYTQVTTNPERVAQDVVAVMK